MIILYSVVFLFGVSAAQEIFQDQDIIRPCPELSTDCVRSFFVESSGCTPKYGATKIFNIKYLSMPVPHANLTYIWKDTSVHGLERGIFKELYINRETNNLVIEMEFKMLLAYSPDAYIKYYFKGREPLVLAGYTGVAYSVISITLTVPFDPVYGIKWSDRDYFTYFELPAFPYTLNENQLCNKDPLVQASFSQLLDNVPLSVREVFPVVGPHFFNLYFKDKICEF